MDARFLQSDFDPLLALLLGLAVLRGVPAFQQLRFAPLGKVDFGEGFLLLRLYRTLELSLQLGGRLTLRSVSRSASAETAEDSGRWGTYASFEVCPEVDMTVRLTTPHR